MLTADVVETTIGRRPGEISWKRGAPAVKDEESLNKVGAGLERCRQDPRGNEGTGNHYLDCNAGGD